MGSWCRNLVLPWTSMTPSLSHIHNSCSSPTNSLSFRARGPGSSDGYCMVLAALARQAGFLCPELIPCYQGCHLSL